MKSTIKLFTVTILSALALSANAGNENRSGSAAGSQLLINPWAKSSGLMSANMASVNDLESGFLNVAGLASIKRTAIGYTFTDYMVGSDVSINSVAIGQKIGDAGVLSVSIMTVNYGDIEITSSDLPEGGVGKFSPRNSNFALSYARQFSNSIHGGVTVRVISESVSNVSASGVAFDAGIKYITGEDDRFRFGITLKNFGPPLKYEGDGLFVNAEVTSSEDQLVLRQTSEAYEIPALLSIAGSFDFLNNDNYKLTGHGAFVSNSFSRDQFNLGAELGFKDRFFVRGGYMLERTTTEDATSATAYTGFAGGASIKLPLGGADASIDYSYRDTNPFAGVHSIGVSIALQ